MSKIANNLAELIENTPLLVLINCASVLILGATLISKLECFYSLSSVKNRIIHAMVSDAEKNDLLIKTGLSLIYQVATK